MFDTKKAFEGGEPVMEPRLVALSLLLEALGVPVSTKTIADRKRIQKAVYLAQRAGADLGYNYGWYVRGPYSPSLADDYYALSTSKQPDGEKRYYLGEAFRQAVKRLGDLRHVPGGVELPDEDWLELLASLDFLSGRNRAQREAVLQTLNRQKSHLVRYVDKADRRLQEMSLAH